MRRDCGCPSGDSCVRADHDGLAERAACRSLDRVEQLYEPQPLLQLDVVDMAAYQSCRGRLTSLGERLGRGAIPNYVHPSRLRASMSTVNAPAVSSQSAARRSVRWVSAVQAGLRAAGPGPPGDSASPGTALKDGARRGRTGSWRTCAVRGSCVRAANLGSTLPVCRGASMQLSPRPPLGWSPQGAASALFARGVGALRSGRGISSEDGEIPRSGDAVARSWGGTAGSWCAILGLRDREEGSHVPNLSTSPD
jgi:hypothetical protein